MAEVPVLVNASWISEFATGRPLESSSVVVTVSGASEVTLFSAAPDAAVNASVTFGTAGGAVTTPGASLPPHAASSDAPTRRAAESPTRRRP